MGAAITRVASGGLAEKVGRMRASVEEIRTMEIEMHRIALNASIRVAHIDAPGDALGILAGSMQQQASESRGRSESAGEGRGCMGAAATRLSGKDGPSGGGSEDCGLDEMRTGGAELHSSNQRSFAQIAWIVASGDRRRHQNRQGRTQDARSQARAAQASSPRRRLRGRLVDGRGFRAGHRLGGVRVPKSKRKRLREIR
jgi:hypothetical protein